MLAETVLDAFHKVPQARVDHLVVSSSSLVSTGQEATSLHQAQMLGGQVARYVARVRKLPHRVFPLEHHLHHAKADWVTKCA